MRLSDVLQLPEKTYTPKGNGVQGKIMAVGPAVQKGEWYSQPVTLLGIDNTQSPVEHSSKHPDGMLNQSHIGKDSTWRLKWWMNNKLQRQLITGYPETKIQGEGNILNQSVPTVPYSSIPAVPYSNPAKPVNGVARSIVQGRTIDAKDEMICRQTAGKVAGEVVAAWIGKEGISFDITGKLLEISDMMSMWFISGNAQAEEPQAYDVCASCQLLRVDCTCPTESFVVR